MAKNDLKPETSSRGQATQQGQRSMERVSSRRSFQSPLEELFDFFLQPSRAMTPSVDVDVDERDNEYLVSVDLPGFKKEDIKIECAGEQLTISAEHSEEERQRRSSRRFYGSFVRTFTLPPNTNAGQIRADYENGVLMVHVPRAEELKARQIKIGSGASQSETEATTH